MWTKTRLVCVALCLLVQSTANAAGAEQRLFSMEDESVKNPASVPPEVIALLARDSQVRDALTDEHLAPDAVPSSWLLASEIHLGSASEKDLVVMANGPLQGANVTTFWIFRPTDHRYELLLKAPAQTLAVKNRCSNGYRDIELWSATAVTESRVLCKFKGGTYLPAAKKLEPIQ